MSDHVKGPGQLSEQPFGGKPFGLAGPDPDAPAIAGANAHRLLYAGFMAIAASGVGFSVRAGILGLWGAEYGFTQTELGGITGGGLTGFGVIIIIGSLIADRIGYGKLMGLAFLLHVLSAAMQLSTGYVFQAFGGSEGHGKDAAYWNLFLAMFLFSVANGVCEVVVNPMTATLFPKQKTHYLNILHAGWPAGLVAGGLLSYVMNGGKIGSWSPLGGHPVHWMIQMSMFLIPVAIYGVMLLGQRLPRSEAAEAGVSSGAMLVAVLSPVFFVLLLAHALVGYVELGTDSWIAKITGTIMQAKTYGLLLFVYTSILMTALRFFAGPIVEKISPLGLLCVSGILGCCGLVLLGRAPSGGAEGVSAPVILFCVLAATVYAMGKTFLWPTMLAVASERFPKGGAIAIGMMGGAGMLSAGLFGGPGIGFKQDYFATAKLTQPDLVTAKDESDEAKKKEKIVEYESAYDRYKADKKNTFLFAFEVQGLDGSKTGVMDLATTPKDSDDYEFNQGELERRLKDKKLNEWWTEYKIPDAEKKSPPIPPSSNKPPKEMAEKDKEPIGAAALYGGQMALQWTAVVPATMAVLYLLLILYFRLQGGYKAVGVHEQKEHDRGEGGTYGEEPPQTLQ
jgi:MFS family permease